MIEASENSFSDVHEIDRDITPFLDVSEFIQIPQVNFALSCICRTKLKTGGNAAITNFFDQPPQNVAA